MDIEVFFELLQKAVQMQRELLCAYQQDIMRYKKIYLLGAGKGGAMVAQAFEGISDKAVFIDGNQHKIGKDMYGGISCKNWDFIQQGSDSIALLTSIKNTSDMVKKVLDKCPNMRIDVDYIRLLTRYLYSKETIENKDQIMKVYRLVKDDESRRVLYRVLQNRVTALEDITADIYDDQQYFRDEFREFFDTDEVLLDGGAYTGDTSLDFIRYIGGTDFKRIYAFELDKENYKVMLDSETLKDNRIRMFNLGLSSKNDTIKYLCSQACSSYVKDVILEDAVEGKIIAFDDFAGKESTIDCPPTIIKMDIEGAEMDALKGMENTIINNRPKLLICIYHLREDLWNIPLYLSELLQDYEFFIRHHSLFHAETVLYGFNRKTT